jgi:hypothetical protein
MFCRQTNRNSNKRFQNFSIFSKKEQVTLNSLTEREPLTCEKNNNNNNNNKILLERDKNQSFDSVNTIKTPQTLFLLESTNNINNNTEHTDSSLLLLKSNSGQLLQTIDIQLYQQKQQQQQEQHRCVHCDKVYYYNSDSNSRTSTSISSKSDNTCSDNSSNCCCCSQSELGTTTLNTPIEGRYQSDHYVNFNGKFNKHINLEDIINSNRHKSVPPSLINKTVLNNNKTSVDQINSPTAQTQQVKSKDKLTRKESRTSRLLTHPSFISHSKKSKNLNSNLKLLFNSNNQFISFLIRS